MGVRPGSLKVPIVAWFMLNPTCWGARQVMGLDAGGNGWWFSTPEMNLQDFEQVHANPLK